jgi:23S rRNA U2552 (ribose-2'-O)-methylase RlmE/FtsJ
MKAIAKIVTLLLIILSAVGCREINTLTDQNKKPIQGGAYEVLVVCNNSEWEGKLGSILRELLEQPVEMLNQNEPMFNVLRVSANDFRHLLIQHRNILKVVISDKVTQAQIVAQYDVDAAPQIVLTFQAPTQQAALEYLNTNGDALVKVLEIAERNRTIAYAEKHNVKVLNDLLRSEFDIEVRIPKGYELRSQSQDFLWASYEFPTASQGFFCYSYPYRGK